MSGSHNNISGGVLRGGVVQAGHIDQVVFRADTALPLPAVARPVMEWDAFSLGVHRAIGGSATPPQFVARPHDRRVTEALAGAADRAGLVVLRGGSSVGKTRSAFEAVRDVLPSWSLVFPPDAAALVDVLPHLAPHTVLWLDELQLYLDGVTGEQAAAGLRTLLTRSDPVIVIGTVWPEYWQQYTIAPATPSDDEFPQARALLRRATCIAVPDVFDPADLVRAQQTMVGDTAVRRALAVARADGRLAQTLAGAQDLVDRFEQATDPFARAVLAAAMDATALGHRGQLPIAMLADAVIGYLDERARANPPAEWLDHALRYAGATLRGAAAALTAVRSQPGLGPADGYVLADYLHQYGRRQIQGRRLPASLWQALLDHTTDPADWARIGSSARARAYYTIAAECYQHAGASGGRPATRWLAERLVRTGHRDDAIDLWRPLAAHGDTTAIRSLAQALDHAGRETEGQTWRRRAAEAGNTVAMRGTAYRLDRSGESAQADSWWRRAAEAGDQVAARSWAARLARRDSPQAQVWWERCIAAGDGKAISAYAKYLDEHGDPDRARHLWQRAARAGDITAIEHLAGQATREGRPQDAAAWWRHLAWQGHPDAIRTYAALLQQTDLLDIELPAWRVAVRLDQTTSVRRLALLLLALDRGEEARALCQSAIAAGNGAVAWSLASLAGVPAEPLAADLSTLAATGNGQAVRALAWALYASGRANEAVTVLIDAVHTGQHDALPTLTRLYRLTGRNNDADQLRTLGLQP